MDAIGGQRTEQVVTQPEVFVMADPAVFPDKSSRLLPTLPGTTLGAGFDGNEFDPRDLAWNAFYMRSPGTSDEKPRQFTKDTSCVVNLVIDETKLPLLGRQELYEQGGSPAPFVACDAPLQCDAHGREWR